MATTNFDPSNEVGTVLTAFAASFLSRIGQEGEGHDSAWSDLRNPDVEEGNSILDSEILLTFLLPEEELETVRMESSASEKGGPNILYSSFRNVADYNLPKWNRLLQKAFFEYFARNSDEDGEPLYSSNSYLTEVEDGFLEGKKIETVDGYSFSLSASIRIKIIAVRMVKEFEGDIEQKDWQTVSDLATRRITGALKGLTDSFCVAAWPAQDWQDGLDEDATSGTGWKWPKTREIRALEEEVKSLGYTFKSGKAFEIGWSWGPVDKDRFIDTQKSSGRYYGLAETYRSTDMELLAEPSPYLYFTINALDGISDLSLEKVESGGLLDREQLQLASTLKSLANLTANYWMLIGKTPTPDDEIHPGEWMIETMPWKTSDGQASLYWNVHLARLILSSNPLTTAQYERFFSLSQRMAEAARISTPPYPLKTDPVVPAIHAPGLKMSLMAKKRGTDEDCVKVFEWTTADFAPQLLKMVGQISSAVNDSTLKQKTHRLMSTIWAHLDSRTSGIQGQGWDKFWAAWGGKYAFFPTPEEKKAALNTYGFEHPLDGQIVNSWYITERVAEALVVSASAWRKRPSPSPQLRAIAEAMIQEIQWSLTMSSAPDDFIQEKRILLESCRTRIVDQPGLALSKLMDLQAELGERDI